MLANMEVYVEADMEAEGRAKSHLLWLSWDPPSAGPFSSLAPTWAKIMAGCLIACLRAPLY